MIDAMICSPQVKGIDRMSRRSALNWRCGICAVDVPADVEYCQMCLVARPLDRSGVPQIFQDLVIHFNGIIPRTLKHPSHSIEWRMAERHGARCTNVFDPQVVTTLVYRTGYERSDKVRLCVERYMRIPCVPVAWMLDLLLQSRQIHPSLYRLQAVPAVALPTVRGSNLPHQQHPFFVMNADEYALSTSITAQTLKRQGSSTLTGVATAGGTRSGADGKAGIPRTRPVPDAEFEAADVWKAAAAASLSARSVATYSIVSQTEQEDDFEGDQARSGQKGLELFARQLSGNKCDPFLFRGLKFILSESLACDPAVGQVLAAFGASIVTLDPALKDQALVDFISQSSSYLVYHSNDKKRDLLIHAAVAKPVTLCSSTWVEDCLMLGEVLPVGGPYVPTTKLLNTLQKKFEKRDK